VRVLLSGASGLIGQALGSALEARGDEVVRLRRPSSASSRAGGVAWDPSAGQIDDAALGALGPIDGVVHLAGAGIADKRWSPERKAEILDSRTESTTLLVQALGRLATPPSVLVSASAIGIYGNRGDEVLDETSATGSGYLADVCRRWEAAAQPAAQLGIRVATARTGIVLAREGGALGRQLPLFRAGVGGRLSSGHQWTSWITLTDEVRALCWLLDSPTISGPVNLTAPTPVTNAAFTSALGAALHRPAVLVIPSVALKLALGAELVEEALLASQRVHPAALEADGFSFEAADIEQGLDAVLH
jgi:uncharacterized protein (TIGR01777 family)